MEILQKLSINSDASKDQFGLNVAPLDVPELLENLVRQAEPQLDQLGVKKGVMLFFSPATEFMVESLTSTGHDGKIIVHEKLLCRSRSMTM